MKYLTQKIIYFVCLSLSLHFGYASDSNDICNEIIHLKETDPYIKNHLNISDENIKTLLDNVQRAKFAANSTEHKLLKQFFLNYYPIQTCIKQYTTKGIIGIDETQAPKLHAMIKELSDKLKMPKPFVFISFDETFYNALALSFSKNASLILIGEKLLKDMNDEELKAILSHELGHIHYNHVPKRLFYTSLLVTNYIYLTISSTIFLVKLLDSKKNKKISYSKTLLLSLPISLSIEMLLIMLMPKFFKSQEREADNISKKLAGDEAFTEAMKKLKIETLMQQEKFKNACEFLNQNIQELEKISPYWAKQINQNAKFYKAYGENTYQHAIKDGGCTHPGLDERISTGEKSIC